MGYVSLIGRVDLFKLNIESYFINSRIEGIISSKLAYNYYMCIRIR
jgi:hypothetical protein